MPTKKKRVNLSLSDEIYARLQLYKAKYGIENDATACLQLVVQQLNNLDNSERMLSLINQTSVETFMKMSKEGFEYVKEAVESEKTNS